MLADPDDVGFTPRHRGGLVFRIADDDRRDRLVRLAHADGRLALGRAQPVLREADPAPSPASRAAKIRFSAAKVQFSAAQRPWLALEITMSAGAW